MRRYFFKPTFVKILSSFFLTLSTFYFTSFQSALPSEIVKAQFFVKIGLADLYDKIGPTNPILKFGVIFAFWFAVSWVVYLVVWVLEFMYVKAYNAIVIKAKFINKK